MGYSKMLIFKYSLYGLGFIQFIIFRSKEYVLLVAIHVVQFGLIRIFDKESLLKTMQRSLCSFPCYKHIKSNWCNNLGKLSSNLHYNDSLQPIFDQCSTDVETRQSTFTSKMFEKHLWKSEILSKDAGHRHWSKMG